MLIRNPVFVVWEIFFRVKFSEVRYIWTAWVSCEFITSFTHACMCVTSIAREVHVYVNKPLANPSSFPEILQWNS